MKICIHITAALFLLLPLLNACALLDQSIITISENVHFNTKKDPESYNLEDKAAYKKYLQYRKIEKKEKEKDIIKRMETTNPK